MSILTSLRETLGAQPPGDAVADHIAYQQVGPVGIVTLARPDAHNALGLGGWRRLAALFSEAADDPTLRAMVVRGSGDRAFGAGADIHEFPRLRMSAGAAIDYNEAIAAALMSVMNVPIPVIAMVHGLAVGGGCELAAACDIRIAAAGAQFGIPIGRLGVTLGYVEAAALARLIGPAELKYLLFSGRLISAGDALRIGLVQRVTADPELVGETVSLLGAILSGSQVTMRAAKLVADMYGRPLTARDTERLTRLTIEAYDGSDLKEGVAAFREGRPPRFTDDGSREHGCA